MSIREAVCNFLRFFVRKQNQIRPFSVLKELILSIRCNDTRMDPVHHSVTGTAVTSYFRDEVEQLNQNGITKAAYSSLGESCELPLFFGEGDAPTASFIRDAAKRALDNGETFYGHPRGLPEFRKAIRDYLARLYGVDIHPDRITVPGSAMLGLMMVVQAALGRGDHGLIVSPCWPNIDSVFRVTGANVGYTPQRLTRHGWQLDLEEVFASTKGNTRAIYVNSPCNPTGWVMSSPQQALLLEFCRDRNILLISDEVYHRTVFKGNCAPSFLEVAGEQDPLVVVNGFSKAWAMTGWRLGWVVTPFGSKVSWSALSECFNTGATVFAQFGGIAALAGGEHVVSELRERYRLGRAIVDDALAGHESFSHQSPLGAFYAFPSIRGLKDSAAFARELLAREGVGLAPGYTFGSEFDSHVRLSFAQSHERLFEAVKRLVRFVEWRSNGRRRCVL